MALLHSLNLASLTPFNLYVPCLVSVENDYPMSILLKIVLKQTK